MSKHWMKPVGRQDQAWITTRTTPPCYNDTTLGNRLYIQHKGPNVTNPICRTCKNCSYKCAADCENCHTIQHRAVLIIFPLNLQTITITRMLSSGGEEGRYSPYGPIVHTQHSVTEIQNGCHSGTDNPHSSHFLPLTVVHSAFFVKEYFPVRIFWFLIGGLSTVRHYVSS